MLAGSALATLLGNIGGAISWFNSDNEPGDGPASLSDDLDDVAIPEFSNFFTVLEGQASGALSSFLAAELGEALGLEGFGGRLFTAVASRRPVVRGGAAVACAMPLPPPGVRLQGPSPPGKCIGPPEPCGRSLASPALLVLVSEMGKQPRRRHAGRRAQRTMGDPGEMYNPG